MRKIFIAFVLTAVVNAGCATTVNLAVKNADTIPMNVAVDIRNKGGASTGTISVGDIPPGGDGNQTFEVKNGGSFAVSGSVSSGVKVFSGGYITVTGAQDPLEKEIILKSDCREIDDKKALEILSKSFKNLGPDIGAYPLGVKNALNTMIGALVVAKQSNVDSKIGASEILYTVTPGIFGVYVMMLDDVSFPQTNETQQVLMSGSVSTQVAGSYGPIANFGINWDQSGVYELKWVLRGFGHINKKEDPQKDPVAQFNRLSNDHKNQIKNIIKKNPTAKIYYINRAYVLNRAEMFVKEAKELSAGAEVDAASVIKGSTAYTFKNSTETTNGYGPVVINYWGDEYYLIEIPKNIASGVKTLSGINLNQIFSDNASKDKKEISLLVPTGRSVQFGVKEN